MRFNSQSSNVSLRFCKVRSGPVRVALRGVEATLNSGEEKSEGQGDLRRAHKRATMTHEHSPSAVSRQIGVCIGLLSRSALADPGDAVGIGVTIAAIPAFALALVPTWIITAIIGRRVPSMRGLVQMLAFFGLWLLTGVAFTIAGALLLVRW